MKRQRLQVLVVDNDPDVLETAVLILASLGCNVIPSDSSSEALEMVLSDQPLDLLVTDIVIPGDIDGWTLGAVSRDLRPGLRVVYTSGYIDAAKRAHLEAASLLEKPWRYDQLKNFVDDVQGGVRHGRSGRRPYVKG